jgi:hypothetical protein
MRREHARTNINNLAASLAQPVIHADNDNPWRARLSPSATGRDALPMTLPPPGTHLESEICHRRPDRAPSPFEMLPLLAAHLCPVCIRCRFESGTCLHRKGLLEFVNPVSKVSIFQHARVREVFPARLLPDRDYDTRLRLRPGHQRFCRRRSAIGTGGCCRPMSP